MAGQLQHAQLPPFADILLAQFKIHAKAHVDAAMPQVSLHLILQRQSIFSTSISSEAGSPVSQPSTRHTFPESSSLGTCFTLAMFNPVRWASAATCLK
jgi:hypothetical protein